MKTRLCALTVLAFTLPALAADRLVPSQYPTIQAAIDAAADGDLVLVAPGTYTAAIDLRGKPITLRGASTDAGNVVINGGNAGSAVATLATGETAATIIENLTLTGGGGSQGAGVRIINSSPTIRNCRIINNSTSGSGACRGGGVFVQGGSPTISDCVIGGNSVASSWIDGGGTAWSDGAGGGLCVLDGTVTVRRTLITGNLLRSAASGCNAWSYGFGAGIYKSGGNLILEDCRIQGNSLEVTASAYCNGPHCSGDGAAAYLAPPASLIRCVVSGNSKSGCGDATGGCRFAGAGIEVSASRICGNTPVNSSGPYIDLGGNTIATACPACQADLDGDGKIDGADLAILLSKWGSCPN